LTCNEALFGISTPTQIPELDLQLPVQSVHITSNVVSSNSAHERDTPLCDKVCQ